MKQAGGIPLGLPLGAEEAQAEFSIWAMNNGGGWTDTSGTWAVDQRANVETLEFLRKLTKAGLTQPNPEATNRKDVFNQFAQGEIGMLNGAVFMPGVVVRTLVWVVGVVTVTVTVALGLAQLLKARFPGRRLVRWALIVPCEPTLRPGRSPRPRRRTVRSGRVPPPCRSPAHGRPPPGRCGRRPAGPAWRSPRRRPPARRAGRAPG